MNAIEIKDLTRSYPGFTLGPISLTLPAGCILGLVGENGAGKSTTIRLMLDMLRRDGGTVVLLGTEDISSVKAEVGVMLDENGIPNCLNAGQVERVMEGSFPNWDTAAYKDYIKRLKVPEGKKIKDYSRGMKMKLGIAVALSHHPRLLILDEATSGLDPVARDDVLDILNEFTRDAGNSVLISSHIVSDLEKICDLIAFLHKGQLVLCEEKDQLKEKYSVFHGTAQQLADIDPAAVVGKRLTPYGVDAVVERRALPAGAPPQPVDIEQLFIMLAKEDR